MKSFWEALLAGLSLKETKNPDRLLSRDHIVA